MNTMIDLAVMMSEPAKENWIQIMKTGEFKHPSLGDLKIKPEDLHQFKENFDNKVRGTDLAVDVSHEPDKGAVAWFKELKVDGDKLLAKVAWTEEGANLIKGGKYRYFSPEFKFQYTDAETGKQFKDVLFGGAITNRPFLKNMEPIQFSEDNTYGTVWMADNEQYDPDHDGDNDSTTNPKENPDWVLDVLAGITKWPEDTDQQDKLKKVGATKQASDAAYQMRQKQLGKKANPEPGVSPTKPTDDADAGKFHEDEPVHHKTKPNEGGNTMPEQSISLAEFNAAQERIKMLETENRRVALNDKVSGFLFNENTKKGKLFPAQKDKVLALMESMSDDQVSKFEEVIKEMPDAIAFNDERGHGMSGGTKDRVEIVNEKADALFSEGKYENYRDALMAAEKEVPETIK